MKMQQFIDEATLFVRVKKGISPCTNVFYQMHNLNPLVLRFFLESSTTEIIGRIPLMLSLKNRCRMAAYGCSGILHDSITLLHEAKQGEQINQYRDSFVIRESLV